MTTSTRDLRRMWRASARRLRRVHRDQLTAFEQLGHTSERFLSLLYHGETIWREERNRFARLVERVSRGAVVPCEHRGRDMLYGMFQSFGARTGRISCAQPNLASFPQVLDGK